MYKRCLPVLLAVLLLTGCAAGTDNGGAPDGESGGGLPAFAPVDPPAEAGPETASDPRDAAVEAALSAMSLEEKVGQLFFVRCPAGDAAEKAAEYHLGGYILFKPDFQDSAGEWLTREQFMEKIAACQAAVSVPLLIGVDEEGGTVARASRNPNLFTEKRQSPQAVYARGGLDAVAEDTVFYNSGLLALGINVNLAPVADVSTDPADFIYDRSLGQDAAATAEYVETAVAWMGQCQVNGQPRPIGSVLKHFPGYGGNADTHTGTAVDPRPYEQFQEEDFLPFRAGIDAGAGAVLVSHNVVTCMDARLPASLSPQVHRVLREELGFRGVIMTDDLAMDAVAAYAGDGSAAVMAVLAGNDLIVTTDFETQIPLVVDAVRTGDISQALVDQAVGRVLGWKYDLGLLEDAA